MHDLPTTVLQAEVRCIRIAEQPISVAHELREAIPMFFHQVTSDEFDRLKDTFRKAHLQLFFHEGVPRRYAGNASLSRGKYFSVLNNQGHDAGTLHAELSYYSIAGGKKPTHLIYDLSIPSPELDKLLNCIVLIRVSDGASRVAIKAVNQTVKIPNVLDLRRPRSLQWLMTAVNEGLGGTYRRPFGDKLKSPFELLPSLMWPDMGGGGLASRGAVTRAIGHYLRRMGVAGLVFPSARTDVALSIDRGEVIDWRGWNFVDYRGSPYPVGRGITNEIFFDESSEWPLGFPFEASIETRPETSRWYGSFKVCGPDAYFAKQLRRSFE